MKTYQLFLLLVAHKSLTVVLTVSQCDLGSTSCPFSIKKGRKRGYFNTNNRRLLPLEERKKLVQMPLCKCCVQIPLHISATHAEGILYLFG